MEFYENMVFHYATTALSERLETKLFVHPQFKIDKDINGNVWEAYPDFLFLDMKNFTVYVVEVSSNSSTPNKILNKMTEHYRNTVENYINKHFMTGGIFRNGEVVKWSIVWQVYARERHKKLFADKNVEYISLDKDVLGALQDRLKY